MQQETSTSATGHRQSTWSPTNVIERLATLTRAIHLTSNRSLRGTSYYDYPVLKQPTWRWEIIWYFFFGGLAAGCYVIASIASLFGSKEDRVVAVLVIIFRCWHSCPVPPLLIKGPGKPERFCTCCVCSRSSRLCRWVSGDCSASRFLAA